MLHPQHMMSSSTKCNSNVLQVQQKVHDNVQHQGMLHVFRFYLGATIAALFQQIAFPLETFMRVLIHLNLMNVMKMKKKF